MELDTHTTLVALVVIGLITRYLKRSNPTPNYPPGPWSPIPFIRNAFQIPQVGQWVGYREWEKAYGSSILFAQAFGQKLLILNSYDDAVELLDNRAQITSDRPAIVILELMGWGNLVPIARYGKLWKKQRRMLHHTMKKDGHMLEAYKPISEGSSKRLVQNLIGDGPNAGKNVLKWCKRFAGELILSITYGYKTIDPSLPSLIDDMSDLTDANSKAALPGAYLVNIIPEAKYIPRWLPGGGFHPVVEACREKTKRLGESTLQFAKQRREIEVTGDMSTEDDMNSNERDERMAPKETMVSQWIELMDKKEPGGETFGDGLKKLGVDPDVILKDTGMTTFAAGHDTTVVALSWFIVAMAKYHSVQEKAHNIIRDVIGPNRLPTFEDRSSLPYIEAIYMETLRWGIPVPLSVPHRSTEDEIYKGYFIPAGTVIIPNVWAMVRDEERYPDPEEFRPERFLNEDGSVKRDERILAYGFGRRVCAGKYLAADSLWIAMTTILASLQISKEKDENGNEIEISTEMTSELVSRPIDMRCAITKRAGAETLFD